MITPEVSLREKTVTVGEAVCAIDILIIGGRKNVISGKQYNNFSKCYIELSIGPTILGIKTDMSMNVPNSIIVNSLRVRTTQIYVNC